MENICRPLLNILSFDIIIKISFYWIPLLCILKSILHRDIIPITCSRLLGAIDFLNALSDLSHGDT